MKKDRLSESIFIKLTEEDEAISNVNSIDKLEDFVRDRISYYCTDGFYDIYWDYQDIEALEEVAGKYIDEALENADKNNSSVIDELSYIIEEHAWSQGWFDGSEEELMDSIFSDVKNAEDEELYTMLQSVDDPWELFATCGYEGVNSGIKENLKNIKLPMEFLISTPAESNSDMSNLVMSYGSYDDPNVPNYTDDKVDLSYFDNGLTFLIHQQGHTVREVLGERLLGETSESKFVSSVCQELINNTAEIMSGVFACVKVNLEDIDGTSGSLEFGTDTTVGIANIWNGSGSLMEIALEKPLIVPKSMIRSYTGKVSEIYGWSDYDGSVSVTNATPTLVSEDLEATVKDIESKME